jgi:two-component system phosphate regulon sensor histidine kinase PhoR
MNKTTKKVGILLLVIIILPVILLTLNEVSSLSDNEKVLETIYTNQLEAVLFSVNQYSEDVVSSWASRVDELLDKVAGKDDKPGSKMIDSLLEDIPSLVGLFIVDSVNDEQIKIYPDEISFIFTQDIFDSLNTVIQKILADNQKLITRLYTYKRGGYRKIEPISSSINDENSVLIFIEETPDKFNRLTALIINSNEFIQRILSPKIQEIAGDEFVISIFKNDFQFNSNKQPNRQEVQQERELWIFPDYKIGISLIGQSIEDIVQQRAINNFILIFLLTIVLIVGVWFVYRNVRKEIDLAQVKSDFVSNVSHELRTPLALISMFSETLEMNRVKTEEKRQEYYRIISNEANRLGRIVNTILNFSKMEAGQRKFFFEEKDLNEIVEQIFDNYKFHLTNQNFKFTFAPNENLPKIKIDEEAASEAIINLIDNAVKYSNNNKEIVITTGSDYKFVFVEVTDRGIGISSIDQKKIFDKFFRVSTGLVHNAKGTGLGLSLVKSVMDAHIGKVRVNSKLSEGSTFTLLFPVINNNQEL